MTRLRSSGQISINDLRNEFGDTNSPGHYIYDSSATAVPLPTTTYNPTIQGQTADQISNFYKGGINSHVPAYDTRHNPNVPTSGTIELADFYSAHKGWDVGRVSRYYRASNWIYYGYSPRRTNAIRTGFGLLSPTHFRGVEVWGFTNEYRPRKTNSWRLSFYLQGSRPRNFFTRYYDPSFGNLYTSNSREYFTTSGYTCWRWYPNFQGQWVEGRQISPLFFL